jgi:WD40 repeat protein
VSGYVFISYAREDAEYVEKLVAFLRDEGVDVWYDAHLVPGRRFDEAIQQKIKQCAAFVLIMTPAADNSPWVHDELDHAKENDRDLMPMLLDGKKFFGLGHIQCEQVQGGEMPSQLCIKSLKSLVGEGELLHELKAHEGQVRSVAYPASNPSMVASAGPEMTVRIWHPGTGQLIRAIQGATWPVSFTRYGEKIATGGPGHQVHLWDTQSGDLIRQIGQHKKALTSVAIAPDGQVLVTGSADTLEHVWDVQTGELLRTLSGQIKPASPLVIAPDGTWLIAPTESGSTLGACLWNVHTGKRIGSLKGHKGPVHDVTVSWDGRYVATAGEDNTARIWDARTGDELHQLGSHRRPVRAVAFSPNGYRVATGSTDQTIRLWDATTGAHIRCITSRAGGIYDLAYSPDGRTLASGHGDGAIRIWKA